MGWSTGMRSPGALVGRRRNVPWQRSSGHLGETVAGEGRVKLRWTLKNRRSRTSKVPQLHAQTSRQPSAREGPGKRLKRPRPGTPANPRTQDGSKGTHLHPSLGFGERHGAAGLVLLHRCQDRGDRGRESRGRGEGPGSLAVSAAAPASAPAARRSGPPSLCCAPQIGKVSNLQELEDVALSGL